MNPELVAYIEKELRKGTDIAVVREALIRKGWRTTDIDAAFADVSSDIPVPEGAYREVVQEEERRVLYAKVSLGLFGGAIISLFLYPPVAPLALVLGIVLAIIGIRSSKRSLAITSLILNIVGALLVGYLFMVAYQIATTGLWPDGTELTKEEYLEIGFTEEDYESLRNER